MSHEHWKTGRGCLQHPGHRSDSLEKLWERPADFMDFYCWLRLPVPQGDEALLFLQQFPQEASRFRNWTTTCPCEWDTGKKRQVDECRKYRPLKTAKHLMKTLSSLAYWPSTLEYAIQTWPCHSEQTELLTETDGKTSPQKQLMPFGLFSINTTLAESLQIKIYVLEWLECTSFYLERISVIKQFDYACKSLSGPGQISSAQEDIIAVLKLKDCLRWDLHLSTATYSWGSVDSRSSWQCHNPTLKLKLPAPSNTTKSLRAQDINNPIIQAYYCKWTAWNPRMRADRCAQGPIDSSILRRVWDPFSWVSSGAWFITPHDLGFIMIVTGIAGAPPALLTRRPRGKRWRRKLAGSEIVPSNVMAWCQKYDMWYVPDCVWNWFNLLEKSFNFLYRHWTVFLSRWFLRTLTLDILVEWTGLKGLNGSMEREPNSRNAKMHRSFEWRSCILLRPRREDFEAKSMKLKDA